MHSSWSVFFYSNIKTVHILLWLETVLAIAALSWQGLEICDNDLSEDYLLN